MRTALPLTLALLLFAAAASARNVRENRPERPGPGVDGAVLETLHPAVIPGMDGNCVVRVVNRGVLRPVLVYLTLPDGEDYYVTHEADGRQSVSIHGLPPGVYKIAAQRVGNPIEGFFTYGPVEFRIKRGQKRFALKPWVERRR